MKTLARASGWRFHLITFEQPQHALDETERKHVWRELIDEGIAWYPKRHHTGRFLLVKKAWDFVSVASLLGALRIRGVSVIWSFANVAASIALVYSKILFFKTVIYSYEPHSRFMVELGIWHKDSWRYRVLNFLENKAGHNADFVLTGTEHMRGELIDRKVKGKVYRAPTGVDENDFYFRSNARHILNVRHGFSDSDKLIIYIGKLGGLYYTFQVPLFFRICKEHLSECRFIIITPNSYEDVVAMAEEAGLEVNHIVYLTRLSYEEIKIYMSGADLGISAVPPTPSQRFRSPTKVAEYLLCGLPYVTCEGVSEDDIVARESVVGVVVRDFTREGILDAIPAIKTLLAVEKREMVNRCREAGLRYRAKSNVDEILRIVFNELAK